ncbi:hypothetical protein ES288_A04G009900v1, partial [Gossypium darwinii]
LELQLYGNFPSDTTLFLLPYLQKLNLAYNDFNRSKIPYEFGRFESLLYLNLSHARFVGEVPSQVSHLSKLVRHLFLDEINMPFVNAHVFMNLSSSLRPLSLVYCELQGKFPKNIFDLPNLNFLNLGGNQNLNLDHLKFNWSSNLEHLDLSWISLFTELIDSIDNLQALKYLPLSGNSFFQELSVSITNLSSLEYLIIGDANLFAGLPDSMGNLVSLKFLDLPYSNLLGPVPRSLGNLLQLTHLDLLWNQLSGQNPSSILNLKEGSIPDEVTAFPNLISLYLYRNLLNGKLPSWLYTAPSLKEIDLSRNQFSGHIKEFQSKSLELIALSLTSNTTSSVNHILPNLAHLLLSSCNLSEFPQFLKWLKSLVRLDISCNRIESKILQWMQEVSYLIYNASSLRIVDLSHNNLSGTIPQCFGNLSNSVEFLNLKKNKFYGTIPSTFAKGCQLSNFNLNGNLLEGPLTPSILNYRGLEVLDLGSNKINDAFPHWLGSLPQLQILVLKSNQIYSSLCVNSSRFGPFFSKIQIFDLSSNYFSGPLPLRYINSFKAIINLTKDASTRTYMGMKDFNSSIGIYSYSIGIVVKGQDITLNKIFIPKVIGKRRSLNGLNLSHNNLSGYNIPSSIESLTNLEWLGLSSNKLVGRIPRELLNLTALSTLNLSMNELIGCIPQGKQFNTFANTSYEGNKGLHGFPLSSDCNNNELPPPSNLLEEDDSKSNIAFGWKAVLIGYGCGVVFGMTVGYVVFQTGKPKWFVDLVED